MIRKANTEDVFHKPADLPQTHCKYADNGQINQHRHFDPAVGRIRSHDPLACADSLGADMNLHRYVGNSPLNPTDPSGM